PDPWPVSLRPFMGSAQRSLHQRQRVSVPVSICDGRARRASVLRKNSGDAMRRTKVTTRIRSVLAAFTLVFTVASPPASTADSKLHIMTATTDLAALAQEIGGEKVEVESVARGYQDPHFVEAKPNFLLKLRHADLLIVVGLELEIGWLPPLITQSTNPKIQVRAPGYFHH